jgi:hypothetical protein
MLTSVDGFCFQRIKLRICNQLAQFCKEHNVLTWRQSCIDIDWSGGVESGVPAVAAVIKCCCCFVTLGHLRSLTIFIIIWSLRVTQKASNGENGWIITQNKQANKQTSKQTNKQTRKQESSPRNCVSN